jgi:hypothetical protein
MIAVQRRALKAERGRFSYLELATAQQDLLALRAVVIEAAETANAAPATIRTTLMLYGSIQTEPENVVEVTARYPDSEPLFQVVDASKVRVDMCFRGNLATTLSLSSSFLS